MENSGIYIENIASVIEFAGVLVIVTGGAISFARYIFSARKNGPESYKLLRQQLGKSILLGLEILVAADIIATVVTEPSMDQVLTLGLIVLIRTFLSFSLEVEIEGRFPWSKPESVNNTLTNTLLEHKSDGKK
ncbi:MAG: DUF1622 domain-containing protein [Chitinophagaceae bacterium]|nr:MAG: DUF1622 domain-containing protein [Chitinophagaceae bacterium]